MLSSIARALGKVGERRRRYLHIRDGSRVGIRMYPRILACGDQALTVEFGDAIDAALNHQVIALDAALRALGAPILETVPTYRSLLVEYDGSLAEFHELRARIEA